MRLFVYGTLRRSASHPRHALLQPSTFAGFARFQGKLYDLGSYPAAIASTDPADTVRGEVYLLHEPAATLAALDRYEGCTPEDALPHEYVRVTADVRLEAGDARPFSTQIYLYNRPVENLPQIKPGDYLDWLTRRSSVPADDRETRTPPAGSTAVSD